MLVSFKKKEWNNITRYGFQNTILVQMMCLDDAEHNTIGILEEQRDT
jgi:hypothetical protein